VISANGAEMTIIVVAGLDPATHSLSKRHLIQMMDARVEPAYDELS
jgi:hypothetical protein